MTEGIHDVHFAQHLQNLKVYIESDGKKCTKDVALWSIRKLGESRGMRDIDAIASNLDMLKNYVRSSTS